MIIKIWQSGRQESPAMTACAALLLTKQEARRIGVSSEVLHAQQKETTMAWSLSALSDILWHQVKYSSFPWNGHAFGSNFTHASTAGTRQKSARASWWGSAAAGSRLWEKGCQKRRSTCDSSPRILLHLLACSALETSELQDAAEPQSANSLYVCKDNSEKMLFFCGVIKHHGHSSVEEESFPHP